MGPSNLVDLDSMDSALHTWNMNDRKLPAKLLRSLM